MTVLIATCGRPDSLRETLQKLASADGVERVTKVVIVENDDEPRLAGCLDESPLPIELHYTEVKSKSLALNRGLEHCADGLILLTDDDVGIESGWINAYRKAAEQHGPGTFFGGVHEANYETTPRPEIVPYMTGSMKSSDHGGPEGWVSSASSFVGFNWAAWKQDLIAIGGFDERFGPGATTGATGQESDAQRRLRKHGCRGYLVPQARVFHQVESIQVSPDWIIKRRGRAGRELGLWVRGRVPKPFRAMAARLAVWALKRRFRRSVPIQPQLAEFDVLWWKSYLDGALETCDGVAPRRETRQ